MKILLIGMNHRTAPLEVRELFAIDDPGPALVKLAADEAVEEVAVVSTCNRVELVVTTRHLEAARMRLLHFFEHDLAGGRPLPDGGRMDDYLYDCVDGQAVRHLFRVTSSIDSMVVGEPQILGQVKDAYRASVDVGVCGPILSRLFQQAFATAKRVKNETRVAERPVSVARVAVDLARQIFEDLADKRALLVGAGDMIEAALHALREEGLSSVRVANRTRARAEALAERFGATPHGLEELDTLLAGADVVLSCIGGDGFLLSQESVQAALSRRRHRPIFIIDIGVPRNVDPRVDELDDAYLYDVDDLQDVTAANVERRQREVEVAERIVEDEQQHFDGWMVALQAVPTIRDLRARAEEIRAAELDRSLTRLTVDAGQRDGIDRLTRSIVNKLLHGPLSRLRAETDREEGMVMLEATRALFGLDVEATGSGEESDAADVEEPPDSES